MWFSCFKLSPVSPYPLCPLCPLYCNNREGTVRAHRTGEQGGQLRTKTKPPVRWQWPPCWIAGIPDAPAAAAFALPVGVESQQSL